MEPAVKRPYASARRRAQALATRRRLAASARRLFAERGYAATTIGAIAQEADLAVQTFYATYGSKRAVLFALLDELDQAADVPGLLERLRAAGTNWSGQLEALVDFNMRLFGSAIDVLEIVRSAGAADPDIAALARAGDDRRRAGLDEAGAADILWSLTSPELFQLFVVRQHWPLPRYASWLRDALQRLLFP
jgi:AcrR family transcriptional regulator